MHEPRAIVPLSFPRSMLPSSQRGKKGDIPIFWLFGRLNRNVPFIAAAMLQWVRAGSIWRRAGAARPRFGCERLRMGKPGELRDLTSDRLYWIEFLAFHVPLLAHPRLATLPVCGDALA